MATNSEWEEENEEEEDEATQEDRNCWLVYCIDCGEEMFEKPAKEGTKSAFEDALNAGFQLLDHIVLTKRVKSAVTFFHPDASIRNMLSYSNNFLDSVTTLKDLCDSPLETLKEKFSTESKTSTYKFSHFLIDCMKIFISVNVHNAKHLQFVTVSGDPSYGDAKERSAINQELINMSELNVNFTLLPLKSDFNFDEFYNEAYTTLNKQLPKFYYNLETLVEALLDSAVNDIKCIRMKFYLSSDADEGDFIKCKQQSIKGTSSLFPNQLVCRTTMENVIRVADDSQKKYRVVLGNVGIPLENGKADKEALTATDDIKMGITLVYASKTSFSYKGLISKEPTLLREDTSERFRQLWDACMKENYFLLCIIKYRTRTPPRSAELTPMFIDGARCFKVLLLPNGLELTRRFLDFPSEEEMDPPMEDETSDVIRNLVRAMTIEDLDLKTVYPKKFVNGMNYCKKQLIPSKNVKDAIPNHFDLLNKVHCKDKKAVDELIHTLHALNPEMSDGKKKGTKRKLQK